MHALKYMFLSMQNRLCINGLGVGWGGGTHCSSEIVQPETTFHVTVQPLVMMTFVLQDGSRPLYTASRNGHLDVVETLLEAGANINQAKKVQ